MPPVQNTVNAKTQELYDANIRAVDWGQEGPILFRESNLGAGVVGVESRGIGQFSPRTAQTGAANSYCEITSFHSSTASPSAPTVAWVTGMRLDVAIALKFVGFSSLDANQYVGFGINEGIGRVNANESSTSRRVFVGINSAGAFKLITGDGTNPPTVTDVGVTYTSGTIIKVRLSITFGTTSEVKIDSSSTVSSTTTLPSYLGYFVLERGTGTSTSIYAESYGGYFRILFPVGGVFGAVKHVNKPDDSSLNVRHLNESGAPANRSSGTTRFGDGYNFDGTDDSLFLSNNATLRIYGDLSIVCAFQRDTTPAINKTIISKGMVFTGQASHNNQYVIFYNSSNQLVYNHESGNESTLVQFTGGSIGTGLSRLTLRRRAAVGATPGNVTIKLNGATIINSDFATNPDQGTDVNNIFILGFHNGTPASETNRMDGGIFEVRVWDKLVDQSLLDEIMDTTLTKWILTPEGTEAACYFLEEYDIEDFGDH